MRSGTGRAPGLLFAITFSIGCAVIDRAFLWPSRHWHCLPLTVLLAVACEWLLPKIDGRGGRLGLLVAFSLMTAWLLVPTWESLNPSYPVCVLMLAVYLCLALSLCLGFMMRIESPHTHLVIMLLMLVAVGVAVSAHVSVTYGQLAVIGAVALTTTFGSFRRGSHTDPQPSMMIAPLVVVIGVAWMGLIDPEPPWWSVALLPAGPLICSGLLVLSWPVSTMPDAVVRTKQRPLGPCLIAVSLIVLTATVAYILGSSGEAPTLEEW